MMQHALVRSKSEGSGGTGQIKWDLAWLVTKPEKENEAMEVFGDTAIKISTQGQKHMGTVLGSRPYLEEYMRGKVED